MSSPGRKEAASAAQQLIRAARKSALGTLDAATRAPYVSLVTVALGPERQPLLLLSRLARHTNNLERDPHASLLFDGTDSVGDPLAGGRVTLMGELHHVPATARDRARACFLAVHPDAAMYADFADFGFWTFEASAAHFIGGFGRIVELAAAEVRVPV
jgi:heme iron utilization protein